MKKSSFVVFIVGCWLGFAPQTVCGWMRTYGGPECEEGYEVHQTSDAGYITVGYTESYGAGKKDLWLLKTDSLGNTLWTRTFGGPKDDAGYSVKETPGGGYIVTGYTTSSSMQDSLMLWLLRTDPQGDTLWTKQFSGRIGRCVEPTSDGGFIITSPTRMLIKTDASGNIVWTKSSTEEGFWVVQTSDGGYAVSGRTGQAIPKTLLQKADSVGTIIWSKVYSALLFDCGQCVHQTPDGGFIVAGWASDEMGGWSIGTDIYLIRTNTTGNSIWSYLSNWTENCDMAFSVDVTEDSNYVVSGFKQIDHNFTDLWLVELDDTGDTMWTRTFGKTDCLDYGYGVEQTEDKGYIVTGSTFSYGAGKSDLWLIKTNEYGSAWYYDVSATTIVIPQESDTADTITPSAWFTNLGESEVNNFICLAEICPDSSDNVIYLDSSVVANTLDKGDSTLVTFSKWICPETGYYNLKFFTKSEVDTPWHCTPKTLRFYCHSFQGSGINNENQVKSKANLEIVPTKSGILFKYNGYLAEFQASIFDATGRLVDEIHAQAQSGDCLWGRGFPPGVYFIKVQAAEPATHKFLLIK